MLKMLFLEVWNVEIAQRLQNLSFSLIFNYLYVSFQYSNFFLMSNLIWMIDKANVVLILCQFLFQTLPSLGLTQMYTASNH